MKILLIAALWAIADFSASGGSSLKLMVKTFPS